jgi:EmrB/QacA subfamily drug resistance transporter
VNAPAATAPFDPTTLSPREKMQALAGMLLAMFLAALDQNVVGTAGPEIQKSLHIDASLYTWITTSYLVASTVLVPVYGKLSDIFGRKPIILFGVVVFLGASVLCAVSQTTWQLIGARALQGVGSASLFTSAFAVVGDLFSPAERGRYSGLFGAVFGVSSLIGPLLGGFITDHWGWHWVFLINLPIGAVALWFIVRRMPMLKREHAVRPKVDVVGALLLGVGVIPLLFALTLGRPVVRPGEFGYLWSDPQVLGLFGVAAFGLVSFVWWELRVQEPLVDLRLFKSPAVAYGSATMFLMGAAFLAPMVFLPLFMVNVVGITATASGLTISPMVMGVVAGNVLSGQLVSRLGKYKGLMLGSLVLLMVGFLVMGFTLTSASTQGEVTAKMILLGLGLGPSIPLYTIAVQNAVPPQQMGTMTSMATFLRQMGSTVGIAVVGSLFATTLSTELATRMAEATKGLPPEMVQRFAPGGQGAAASEEGGGGNLARFEPDKVKARVNEQLDGALALTTRALEGDAVSGQLVLSSPFADDRLKASIEGGGVKAQVRARFTVARSKLRHAAMDDASWAEFVAQSQGLPIPATRPANDTELQAIDTALEQGGEAAATAALGQAVAGVKAGIDAQRPKAMATIDAVDRALKDGFTVAVVQVYRLAFFFVVAAFILTLLLPQLPLRGRGGPGAPAPPPIAE